MIKLIMLPFYKKIEKMENWGYIYRKTLPRVMTEVLSTKTVVQKTLLFFQDF